MSEEVEVKIVQKNRKARFDYEILDTVEAGLILKGTEVKSMRDGKASIAESYARFRGNEIFVINMDILAYSHAAVLSNHEPKRPRKLLLHKQEIDRLSGKMKERGLTLIPLSLYFKNGYAKLELGLARGRKKYDKRDVIKKREVDRDLRKRMSKG